MYLPQSSPVRLALNTLLESLGKESIEDDYQDLKKRRAACFVSLHREKGGEETLRGCIGTLSPVRENLYEEIRSNALAAAFSDPRFDPLERDELETLTLSVDVLEEPEHIDGPEKLDPSLYGVIVEADGRRGVLLPDLEGVDTVERQLEIARMKAGIYPGEDVDLFRFKVKRYH